MRLVTVATPEGMRLHVRGSGGYVDVGKATGDERLSDLNAVLAGGDQALHAVRGPPSRTGANCRSPSTVRLARATPCPVLWGQLRRACPRGRTSAHDLARGVRPRSGSVAAPYGDLVKPALSERFDYEGELALVVGKGGRYIRAKHAIDALAGYTVLMDGSAREWQRAATSVDARQELRRHDADRAGDRHHGRGRRLRRAADHHAQRQSHAVRTDIADDLQHPGGRSSTSHRSRP